MDRRKDPNCTINCELIQDFTDLTKIKSFIKEIPFENKYLMPLELRLTESQYKEVTRAVQDGIKMINDPNSGASEIQKLVNGQKISLKTAAGADVLYELKNGSLNATVDGQSVSGIDMPQLTLPPALSTAITQKALDSISNSRKILDTLPGMDLYEVKKLQELTIARVCQADPEGCDDNPYLKQQNITGRQFVTDVLKDNGGTWAYDPGVKNADTHLSYNIKMDSGGRILFTTNSKLSDSESIVLDNTTAQTTLNSYINTLNERVILAQNAQIIRQAFEEGNNDTTKRSIANILKDYLDGKNNLEKDIQEYDTYLSVKSKDQEALEKDKKSLDNIRQVYSALLALKDAKDNKLDQFTVLNADGSKTIINLKETGAFDISIELKDQKPVDVYSSSGPKNENLYAITPAPQEYPRQISDSKPDNTHSSGFGGPTTLSESDKDTYFNYDSVVGETYVMFSDGSVKKYKEMTDEDKNKFWTHVREDRPDAPGAAKAYLDAAKINLAIAAANNNPANTDYNAKLIQAKQLVDTYQNISDINTVVSLTNFYLPNQQNTGNGQMVITAAQKYVMENGVLDELKQYAIKAGFESSIFTVDDAVNFASGKQVLKLAVDDKGNNVEVAVQATKCGSESGLECVNLSKNGQSIITTSAETAYLYGSAYDCKLDKSCRSDYSQKPITVSDEIIKNNLTDTSILLKLNEKDRSDLLNHKIITQSVNGQTYQYQMDNNFNLLVKLDDNPPITLPSTSKVTFEIPSQSKSSVLIDSVSSLVAQDILLNDAQQKAQNYFTYCTSATTDCKQKASEFAAELKIANDGDLISLIKANPGAKTIDDLYRQNTSGDVIDDGVKALNNKWGRTIFDVKGKNGVIDLENNNTQKFNLMAMTGIIPGVNIDANTLGNFLKPSTYQNNSPFSQTANKYITNKVINTLDSWTGTTIFNDINSTINSIPDIPGEAVNVLVSMVAYSVYGFELNAPRIIYCGGRTSNNGQIYKETNVVGDQDSAPCKEDNLLAFMATTDKQKYTNSSGQVNTLWQGLQNPNDMQAFINLAARTGEINGEIESQLGAFRPASSAIMVGMALTGINAARQAAQTGAKTVVDGIVNVGVAETKNVAVNLAEKEARSWLGDFAVSRLGTLGSKITNYTVDAGAKTGLKEYIQQIAISPFVSNETFQIMAANTAKSGVLGQIVNIAPSITHNLANIPHFLPYAGLFGAQAFLESEDQVHISMAAYKEITGLEYKPGLIQNAYVNSGLTNDEYDSLVGAAVELGLIKNRSALPADAFLKINEAIRSDTVSTLPQNYQDILTTLNKYKSVIDQTDISGYVAQTKGSVWGNTFEAVKMGLIFPIVQMPILGGIGSVPFEPVFAGIKSYRSSLPSGLKAERISARDFKTDKDIQSLWKKVSNSEFRNKNAEISNRIDEGLIEIYTLKDKNSNLSLAFTDQNGRTVGSISRSAVVELPSEGINKAVSAAKLVDLSKEVNSESFQKLLENIKQAGVDDVQVVARVQQTLAEYQFHLNLAGSDLTPTQRSVHQGQLDLYRTTADIAQARVDLMRANLLAAHLAEIVSTAKPEDQAVLKQQAAELDRLLKNEKITQEEKADAQSKLEEVRTAITNNELRELELKLADLVVTLPTTPVDLTPERMDSVTNTRAVINELRRILKENNVEAGERARLEKAIANAEKTLKLTEAKYSGNYATDLAQRLRDLMEQIPTINYINLANTDTVNRARTTLNELEKTLGSSELLPFGNEVQNARNLIDATRALIDNANLRIIELGFERKLQGLAPSSTPEQRAVAEVRAEYKKYQENPDQSVISIEIVNDGPDKGKWRLTLKDQNSPLKDAIEIVNQEIRYFEETTGKTLWGLNMDPQGKNQIGVVLDAYLLTADKNIRGKVYPSVVGSGKTDVMIPLIAAMEARTNGTVLVILSKESDVRDFVDNFRKIYKDLKIEGLSKGSSSTDPLVLDANVIVATRDVIFNDIDPLGARFIDKVSGKTWIGDEVHENFKLGIDYNRSTGENEVVARAAGLRKYYETFLSTDRVLADFIARALNGEIEITRDTTGQWQISDRASLDAAYKLIVQSLLNDKLPKATREELTKILGLSGRELEDAIVTFKEKASRHEQERDLQSDLRNSLNAFNSMMKALSETPGTHFGINGKTGVVAPFDNGVFNERTYQNPFDGLAFEKIGKARLKQKAERAGTLAPEQVKLYEPVLEVVTVSGGNVSTNYALFVQKAGKLILFSGTPEPIADTFSRFYGIPLYVGKASVTGESLVFGQRPTHPLNGVISGYSTFDTADFSAKGDFEIALKFILPNSYLSSSDVIAKIRMQNRGLDLVVVDPNGNYRIIRADGTIDPSFSRMTEKQFNQYIRDNYYEKGQKILQLYLTGKHYGADFYSRSTDRFVVITGDHTTLTDFLQSAGRDRGLNGGYSTIDVINIGSTNIAGTQAERTSTIHALYGGNEQLTNKQALLDGLKRLSGNKVLEYFDYLITAENGYIPTKHDIEFIKYLKSQWQSESGINDSVGTNKIATIKDLLDTINRGQGFISGIKGETSYNTVSPAFRQRFEETYGGVEKFESLEVKSASQAPKSEQNAKPINDAKNLTQLKTAIEESIRTEDLPATVSRGRSTETILAETQTASFAQNITTTIQGLPRRIGETPTTVTTAALTASVDALKNTIRNNTSLSGAFKTAVVEVLDNTLQTYSSMASAPQAVSDAVTILANTVIANPTSGGLINGVMQANNILTQLVPQQPTPPLLRMLQGDLSAQQLIDEKILRANLDLAKADAEQRAEAEKVYAQAVQGFIGAVNQFNSEQQTNCHASNNFIKPVYAAAVVCLNATGKQNYINTLAQQHLSQNALSKFLPPKIALALSVTADPIVQTVQQKTLVRGLFDQAVARELATYGWQINIPIYRNKLIREAEQIVLNLPQFKDKTLDQIYLAAAPKQGSNSNARQDFVIQPNNRNAQPPQTPQQNPAENKPQSIDIGNKDMAEKFEQARDKYNILKIRLLKGEITQDQFYDELTKKGTFAHLTDSTGRWWGIGAGTGEWFIYDGSQWNLAFPSIKSGNGLDGVAQSLLPISSPPQTIDAYTLSQRSIKAGFDEVAVYELLMKFNLTGSQRNAIITFLGNEARDLGSGLSKLLENACTTRNFNIIPTAIAAATCSVFSPLDIISKVYNPADGLRYIHGKQKTFERNLTNYIPDDTLRTNMAIALSQFFEEQAIRNAVEQAIAIHAWEQRPRLIKIDAILSRIYYYYAHFNRPFVEIAQERLAETTKNNPGWQNLATNRNYQQLAQALSTQTTSDTKDAFEKARTDFEILRNQYINGLITLTDLEAEAGKIVVDDNQERRWQIGASSGDWFFHDGQKWTKGTPTVNGVNVASNPYPNTQLTAQLKPAQPATTTQSSSVYADIWQLVDDLLITPTKQGRTPDYRVINERVITELLKIKNAGTEFDQFVAAVQTAIQNPTTNHEQIYQIFENFINHLNSSPTAAEFHDAIVLAQAELATLQNTVYQNISNAIAQTLTDINAPGQTPTQASNQALIDVLVRYTNQAAELKAFLAQAQQAINAQNANQQQIFQAFQAFHTQLSNNQTAEGLQNAIETTQSLFASSQTTTNPIQKFINNFKVMEPDEKLATIAVVTAVLIFTTGIIIAVILQSFPMAVISFITFLTISFGVLSVAILHIKYPDINIVGGLTHIISNLRNINWQDTILNYLNNLADKVFSIDTANTWTNNINQKLNGLDNAWQEISHTINVVPVLIGAVIVAALVALATLPIVLAVGFGSSLLIASGFYLLASKRFPHSTKFRKAFMGSFMGAILVIILTFTLRAPSVSVEDINKLMTPTATRPAVVQTVPAIPPLPRRTEVPQAVPDVCQGTVCTFKVTTDGAKKANPKGNYLYQLNDDTKPNYLLLPAGTTLLKVTNNSDKTVFVTDQSGKLISIRTGANIDIPIKSQAPTTQTPQSQSPTQTTSAAASIFGGVFDFFKNIFTPQQQTSYSADIIVQNGKIWLVTNVAKFYLGELDNKSINSGKISSDELSLREKLPLSEFIPPPHIKVTINNQTDFEFVAFGDKKIPAKGTAQVQAPANKPTVVISFSTSDLNYRSLTENATGDVVINISEAGDSDIVFGPQSKFIDFLPLIPFGKTLTIKNSLPSRVTVGQFRQIFKPVNFSGPDITDKTLDIKPDSTVVLRADQFPPHQEEEDNLYLILPGRKKLIIYFINKNQHPIIYNLARNILSVVQQILDNIYPGQTTPPGQPLAQNISSSAESANSGAPQQQAITISTDFTLSQIQAFLKNLGITDIPLQENISSYDLDMEKEKALSEFIPGFKVKFFGDFAVILARDNTNRIVGISIAQIPSISTSPAGIIIVHRVLPGFENQGISKQMTAYWQKYISNLGGQQPSVKMRQTTPRSPVVARPQPTSPSVLRQISNNIILNLSHTYAAIFNPNTNRPYWTFIFTLPLDFINYMYWDYVEPIITRIA